MMKYILFLFFFITSFGCKSENLLATVEIKPTVDLGKISYNSYKLFDIKVTNIGAKDIVIKKIHTSCGCMSTENKYLNYPINHGESLDIKFKYKPLSSGYVEKDIYIYFYNYKKAIKIRVKGIATE